MSGMSGMSSMSSMSGVRCLQIFSHVFFSSISDPGSPWVSRFTTIKAFKSSWIPKFLQLMSIRCIKNKPLWNNRRYVQSTLCTHCGIPQSSYKTSFRFLIRNHIGLEALHPVAWKVIVRLYVSLASSRISSSKMMQPSDSIPQPLWAGSLHEPSSREPYFVSFCHVLKLTILKKLQDNKRGFPRISSEQRTRLNSIFW